MTDQAQEIEQPWTVQEVADWWRCDQRTVRRLIHEGTLKSFRVGKKKILVPQWALREYETGQST